jgi:hypothetical protein
MGQALSWGRSLPSPAWTLVTPLLQVHPTWARDEHEGRGISTSLTPVSGHLDSPPFTLAHALDPSGLGHAAHSLVGSGTPRSRNADMYSAPLSTGVLFTSRTSRRVVCWMTLTPPASGWDESH